MDTWLWILLAVVYIGLFLWLGLSTLRNGVAVESSFALTTT